MTTDKSRADALTDLLPCPFCGREAEAEKIEDACYGVGCQSCDFQLMSGNVGIGWFASEAEAISAWNRRVDASPVQQRAAAPNEDHECVYENGDGICRECVELAKVGRIAPAPADERAAFEALRYIDAQLTEYLEGMPADETSRKLRDVARNALAGSARASSANETDDYETRRQVAEALGIVWPGTVDGKRIGFAWSYLLGCIKDLSSDVRHIYGAYGDACARASANETGAPIGWAWISPTGHVSRFTADFDGKHDELVQGWKVRPVAFCDSVANETGAEGAPRYAEWLHLRAHGEWPNGVPEWARDYTGRMNDFTAATAVIEELAALASRAPAQAAEPVGWIGEGNYYTRNEEIAKRYGCLTPVYAAPQPPALADAREGLTDERIAHIGAAHTNSVVNSTVF
ncbi:Lar family restriction alleviation protein [Burkholderia multivorans]|uniref:Lar family restriction alleviation protein n=1 Tax=Burkholderia multivorans TaxID=87883 RepID=UPI0021C121F7|nr:Lar family restriction alleviation protein [Burkholderia multivorans]